MSDELREKIARALTRADDVPESWWHRDRYLARADAVLAVLPTYEQVGWFHKNLGTLMPLHKPQGWANDREPVFRRGAAVPEGDEG